MNPLKANHNILIFDSGLGGISIYQELSALMPTYNISYVADSLYLPYGEQPDIAVKTRCLKLILELSETVDAMMIIVACNTASTLILDELRTQTHRLVVGVIPAIKPAAKASISKHITLLATPATVTRPYTKQLIKDFASDCVVQCIGSSELVHLAEEKIRSQKTCKRRLHQILNQINSKSDTVILGCTHFPLLKDEIYEFFNGSIQLVDSSTAVAKRAQALTIEVVPKVNTIGSNHYYDTQTISQPEKDTLTKLGFHTFTSIPNDPTTT